MLEQDTFILGLQTALAGVLPENVLLFRSERVADVLRLRYLDRTPIDISALRWCQFDRRLTN